MGPAFVADGSTCYMCDAFVQLLFSHVVVLFVCVNGLLLLFRL